MTFAGQQISDLTLDQLQEAEAWLIEQIQATETHAAILLLGYQEMAETRAKLERNLH